jgi:glutamyl-tRNA synthetase
MMKERVTFLNEFTEQGYYFFEAVKDYDDKTIRKKWKAEQREKFETLQGLIYDISDYDAENIEKVIKDFINDSGLKFGDVFPILRIALSGTMKGPDLFSMIAMLGKEEVNKRLKVGFDYFDEVPQAV